jgi:hypothetical protein
MTHLLRLKPCAICHEAPTQHVHCHWQSDEETLYTLSLSCCFQSLRLVCSSYHELLILGISIRIFLMQWFPLAFCMIVFRHTAGLLWTSDQPVSETSTCTGQHKNTREKHPCPQRDSNPGPPATKRPQTYALDRAATVGGTLYTLYSNCRLRYELWAWTGRAREIKKS